MKKRGYIVMYADKEYTYNTPADGKRRENHKIHWRTWTDEMAPQTYAEAVEQVQENKSDHGTDDYLWRIFAVKGPIDELEAAELDSRTYPRTDKGSTSSASTPSGVGVDRFTVFLRFPDTVGNAGKPKAWRYAQPTLMDTEEEAQNLKALVEEMYTTDGVCNAEVVIRKVNLPS